MPTPRLLGRWTGGRDLYLSSVGSVPDWPSEIEEPKPHFVVFAALDASREPDHVLTFFAAKLIEQGCAYFCAWGPDCERLHDLFNKAENDRFGEEDRESVIMTTGHDDDSLADALEFAVMYAYPDEAYAQACEAVLCVVEPQWQAEIRPLLEDLLARRQMSLLVDIGHGEYPLYPLTVEEARQLAERLRQADQGDLPGDATAAAIHLEHEATPDRSNAKVPLNRPEQQAIYAALRAWPGESGTTDIDGHLARLRDALQTALDATEGQ